jgi:hypothetical protein
MTDGQQELDWLFPEQPEIVDIIMREQGPLEPPKSVGLPQEHVRQVPLGTYTLVIPGDSKPHRTILVVPWKGKQNTNIFKMLIGPDNSLDFQGFGEQIGSNRFRVWRSAASRKEWIRAAEILVTLNQEDTSAAGEAYYILSNRCMRCHHKLSVPESVKAGLGPECRGK